MKYYDDMRNRIGRQVVPLPILYREDYSVDTTGLAEYVTWQMEEGSTNFCLTFSYSQLDFISREEIVEVCRVIVDVVRDDAVFIACTGGGPLHEAIETVREFEGLGVQAAFVHLPEHCLQNQSECGELYARYISDVASQTSIPLLAVALPVPWVSPKQSMLTLEHLDHLCEMEQFIGIKDDIADVDYRYEVSREFAGRIGIIGGGYFSQYILFHHLCNQGELSGMLNPERDLRKFELLDNNDYLSMLKMLEEESREEKPLIHLHWLAFQQVVYCAMGFAETYLMRSPVASATPSQAEIVIEHVRSNPSLYAHIVK